MNDSKPSNPSGGGYATNSAVDVCQIVKTTPLSISFLTLSSNQIMSHVQFEMFCSEVLPYPYSEISK